jgi:hypothetical protein
MVNFYPSLCPSLFSSGAPILAMVMIAEDLNEPVAQSFKSSKSSSLNRSQVDSDDAPNKHREHLLAISSFLFALIWGFGAHLPSRYLQGEDIGDAEGRWTSPWELKCM